MLVGGLVHYRSGLQSELFITENPESVAFGRLIEHAVGVMLYAGSIRPSATLNFWAREKKQSSARVDFVYP
jgi:uncharacterized protein